MIKRSGQGRAIDAEIAVAFKAVLDYYMPNYEIWALPALRNAVA